jgi:hypothetical protein
MLVRYPCMREDDLCDLLKFDKKILRAKLATLKSDRFVQVKLKIETGESNCFVMLRIHDILVWIRIRGSMPPTNESGSLKLFCILLF